ncbi:MAG: DUF4340 domain-containing protein [Ignavibacteriales bacterium]|nr:DUF4340 domain-containing protein [Ignavibacteriales bacterium]
MFNKNSNKLLWIVLAILVIAVILIFTNESTKNERTFKEDLVTIDTAKVTSILIYPKSLQGKEVRLIKEKTLWKVTSELGKIYTVPETKIKNLINQLIMIKPERVAARSKDKWKEYQIDSASTRIEVNEGSKKVLDLMIGKFAFQQPRTMTTFVKLAGDNDIYEVSGFLDMFFNRNADSYRDETVIKSERQKWNKLKFESVNPDSSFELVKINNVWFADGSKTDSAKTDNVLNAIERISNSNYKNIDKASLPNFTSKLTIDVENSSPIIISAYRDSTNYIIESSLNKENYFDGKNIGGKIFFRKNTLF